MLSDYINHNDFVAIVFAFLVLRLTWFVGDIRSSLQDTQSTMTKLLMEMEELNKKLER